MGRSFWYKTILRFQPAPRKINVPTRITCGFHQHGQKRAPKPNFGDQGNKNGLTECEKNQGMFRGRLSIPQNNVMNLNNVVMFLNDKDLRRSNHVLKNVDHCGCFRSLPPPPPPRIGAHISLQLWRLRDVRFCVISVCAQKRENKRWPIDQHDWNARSTHLCYTLGHHYQSISSRDALLGMKPTLNDIAL